MRFFIRLCAAIVLAATLAFGALYWTVAGGPQSAATLQNGAWATDLRWGSADSSLALRAQVALCCVLALERTETIYFAAERDSAGAPLDGACRYRIEGRDPDARWWSITSYGRDNYLIPNELRKYSVSKSNVQRQDDGGFIVRAELAPVDGNWLPTSADGFSLTLRLYNPSPALADGLAAVALPTIVKDACQ